VARLKWFVLALAVVTVPASATWSGAANVVETAAFGMLGGTEHEEQKDHHVEPNNGVRRGGAMRPCGSDEIGQFYPGFPGAYCRVNPKESSPQTPAQKDKVGS